MQTPLTKEMLLPAGPLTRLGRRVFALDQVPSTNAFLLARASELPDGAVAWAEWQSAGRGRLGRRWESPRGASVLLSTLLQEPADSPLLARGTLLAVLAACEAVERATVCKPQVRWPNDLVLSGRKLGGVLVESALMAARAPDHAAGRAVVIGVGINCLQQRGHFGAELAETATSLEIESTQPVDRAAVARGLLERLDALLTSAATDRDAWRAALATWRSRCEDIGTRVTLWQDRQTYRGTVLDISDAGDLLVHLDEGARRYFASATTTRPW